MTWPWTKTHSLTLLELLNGVRPRWGPRECSHQPNIQLIGIRLLSSVRKPLIYARNDTITARYHVIMSALRPSAKCYGQKLKRPNSKIDRSSLMSLPPPPPPSPCGRHHRRDYSNFLSQNWNRSERLSHSNVMQWRCTWNFFLVAHTSSLWGRRRRVCPTFGIKAQTPAAALATQGELTGFTFARFVDFIRL